jgi:hypothetical protein
MMTRTYVAPELIDYGYIADRTFRTPGGKYKGGDPCYHLDKFDEISGLSPSLCEGGVGETEDPT